MLWYNSAVQRTTVRMRKVNPQVEILIVVKKRITNLLSDNSHGLQSSRHMDLYQWLEVYSTFAWFLLLCGSAAHF